MTSLNCRTTAADERRIAPAARFIAVYCRNHHDRGGAELCADCADLLAYVRERLANCPYDPKPKCKSCRTHCYKPQYRERIRAVMRYSGMYFVKRGRIDWLIRYFLT
jgi:predicted amidophosphoribosyltransferase